MHTKVFTRSMKNMLIVKLKQVTDSKEQRNQRAKIIPHKQIKRTRRASLSIDYKCSVNGGLCVEGEVTVSLLRQIQGARDRFQFKFCTGVYTSVSSCCCHM